MAGPITWRNINSSAPNVTGLMSGASNNINNAFSSFNNVLQRERSTKDANRQNTIDNNTEDFRNQLSQFRSTDELEMAQQSGALGQMAEQYGPMIDKSVLRTAPEQRLDSLQQREGRETSEMREGIRFDRELEGYNQQDTAYAREEEQLSARNTAAALRESVLQESDSAADGRAAYINRLDEAGVPAAMRSGLVADFEKEFESRYGLTMAQSGEVDSITQGEQTAADGEIQRAERDYAEAQRKYPVNNVFSFTDPEAVTRGDGLAYLQNELGIDDHKLGEVYNEQIDSFMEDLGIDPSDAQVPMGAIARQAAEQTGSSFKMTGLNKDFSKGEFYKNLKRVYKDYNATEENAAKLRDFTEDYDKRVQQARETVTSARSQAMAERRAKNLRLLQQNRN